MYLAVDQRTTVAGEVLAKRHHGQFGAVVDATEHGLATEEAAEGETIETGLQLAILPDLD